jgi:hypothetical protein
MLWTFKLRFDVNILDFFWLSNFLGFVFKSWVNFWPNVLVTLLPGSNTGLFVSNAIDER